MIIITDSASYAGFLNTCPYPDLLALVRSRVEQLDIPTDIDLSEYAHFIAVEPGDTMDAIERAMGFNPLVNFVDGVQFPHPEFEPSWEWVENHEVWFEAAYVLSDSGFGVVLLVKREQGVPSDLLAMCESIN